MIRFISIIYIERDRDILPPNNKIEFRYKGQNESLNME